MTILDFLTRNRLTPDGIDANSCVRTLMEQMEQGLRGEGNIPMLPSYLSSQITPPKNEECCVLDAGGTNLRSARAQFDENGTCHIADITKIPMPGTQGELSSQQFYSQIAALAKQSGNTERVGFCFSFNVALERTLDGVLKEWCKEVRVPDAVGQLVGRSLRACLGETCASVHVLNDSVAALLGAASQCGAQVGVILGTGINVCYEESCDRISKVPPDLRSDKMIISTEVGEFDGIVKSPFDLAFFANTEDPQLAHAEKQCSGGYLGELICRVWQGAAEAGLLDKAFLAIDVPLAQISDMLCGKQTPVPVSSGAILIAQVLIRRAAKIAAILCAAPVLRCTEPGRTVRIAVEGSQFHKLCGFRAYFEAMLTQILAPYGVCFQFVFVENACLKGAALAAFAEEM